MLQHKGQDNIPPRNTLPFAQPASPPDAMATIYRPARSAMTSGKANTRRWKLRFEPRTAPFVEPLMGWIGGTDTLPQIELDFPSAEAADAYAKRQGLNFIVQGPAEATQDCCPMTPWILGFASDHVAAPNAWVSGIVIGAVATAALTKLAEWEVWINFLLGVWVLVSPWVLSFLARRGAKAVIPIASDQGG